MMSDLQEQVGETPGTSSSRAFANIQRQRSQGPSSNTRSHSAEVYTTPAQGDTPLHATLSSIAEEIVIQELRREAILNLPLPGPLDFEDDFEDDPETGHDNHIRHSRHMMVPKHMFEKIDTFHLNILKEH